MGFKRGRASPCCFSHRSRDLVCVVHGDDFIFAGKEEELDWVEKEMHARFLTKVMGRLGGDLNDAKELKTHMIACARALLNKKPR